MHAERMAEVPDPEVPERAKRRRFTAGYKLAILEELDRAVEPGAKGAILRREGLYPPTSWSGAALATLARWRRLASRGAASRPIPWPGRSSGCAGGPSGWRLS